jgi:DNA-binding transcriptional MocR family regulator
VVATAEADPPAVEGRIAGLLDGWRAGDGPLARRLAERIAGAVADGGLAPGTRLPSQRALAGALAVGRGTVAAAYAMLRERGLLDQGSSLVAAPAWTGPVVDLTGAAPGPGPELAAVVGTLDGTDWAELIAQDGALGGLRPLRDALAARYTALGLPTGPEQVVVTAGTGASLELLGAWYLEPGAAVAVEEPAAPAVLEALRAAGARPLPVGVDRHGARPGAVRRRFEQDAPRLLVVTPAGRAQVGPMPASRRRAIAALAGRSGVPVVEDGTRADLRADRGGEPPPLAAFARGAPVLGLGSMRELSCPDLRVAWIRAPAGVAEALARLQAELGGAARPAAQFLAARLLGGNGQAVAARRAQLAERLEQLTALLAELLPSWTWTPADDGMAVWACLPAGDAAALARSAARDGVLVRPGPGPDDRLLLPLTTAPGLLEVGVRRLARAWAELDAGAQAGRRVAPAGPGRPRGRRDGRPRR